MPIGCDSDQGRFQNHVVVERRSEQIGVLRMNNLQKGLAHGFWNSRSQVFRRMALQNAAPDLLAWARWV